MTWIFPCILFTEYLLNKYIIIIIYNSLFVFTFPPNHVLYPTVYPLPSFSLYGHASYKGQGSAGLSQCALWRTHPFVISQTPRILKFPVSSSLNLFPGWEQISTWALSAWSQTLLSWVPRMLKAGLMKKEPHVSVMLSFVFTTL